MTPDSHPVPTLLPPVPTFLPPLPVEERRPENRMVLAGRIWGCREKSGKWVNGNEGGDSGEWR